MTTMDLISSTKNECLKLAHKYHSEDPIILKAVEKLSPESFLRFFITFHGMTPTGNWQTHTYARYTDSITREEHFFLIPMPNTHSEKKPFIRFENRLLVIDDFETSVYPQSIPYTTPFWYFHYNPNNENQPFHTMTLNLSPSCLEKCVLCAGAKTGRVNNGMDDTLSAEIVIERIFDQHPEAKKQLDSVAIVTGCFPSFSELKKHLIDVKKTVNKFTSASTFRVLEHNVATEAQLDEIVGELGYDIFITLECFDQNVRDIALNGKVGRKGRNSEEFLSMIEAYARYLDANPQLNKHFVRVTYLVGLDSFSVTEYFFQKLYEINKTLKYTTIVPWLSIFTPYNDAMRTIQNKEFSLNYIFRITELCRKYFDSTLLETASGGTNEGFARGLF